MKIRKTKKILFLIILSALFAFTISYLLFDKAKNVLSEVNLYLNYYSSATEVINTTEPNKNLENITYKTTKEGELKLDIYAPINKKYKLSPVLIYIHGGAWQWGNKNIEDNYKPFINSILENGYTVVAIDYRLVNSSVKFPAPVQDCKDAIRWIYKNAKNYNLDEKNIGLFGISAGAHLALLTSYSDNNEFIGSDDLNAFSSKVNYVIAIAPPVVLDGSIDKKDYVYIETFLGKSSSANDFNEKIKDSSPINYVKKGIPNTLVIHGKKDTFVPYSQSADLIDKINKAGAHGEFVTIENGNHDLSSATSFELLKMMTKITGYLSTNLKK